MKFKFPYENILKTKKVGRDVAFRDFAEARGRLTDAEQSLENMKQDVTNTHQAKEVYMSENMSDRDKIELLKWAQVFLEGQEIKMGRQKVEIRGRSQEMEDRRDTLAQAGKDYKIFEKLKDRMKEKFKKQKRKHEQKTIDEIVVMQSARKTNQKT
jgi:flagellar export protein FliJ